MEQELVLTPKGLATSHMNVVDAARAISLFAHAGDRNKHDGELYLLHVNRVAIGARSRAGMWGVDAAKAEAVAWLHDVVEDTVVSLVMVQEWLIALGVDKGVVTEIVLAVDALTKRKGESNFNYYHRVKLNLLARVVKLADLQDNFSRNHLIVDDDTRLRMGLKYSQGMEILG